MVNLIEYVGWFVCLDLVWGFWGGCVYFCLLFV